MRIVPQIPNKRKRREKAKIGTDDIVTKNDSAEGGWCKKEQIHDGITVLGNYTNVQRKTEN